MIIYFDTETTGLVPGQICQLAYVLKDADAINRKNMFFTVENMTPQSSAITGLDTEKLQSLSGGRRFSDSLAEIGADFQTASLIVSHNFKFDYAFMQKEFSRANALFRYGDSLCTMKYFTKKMRLPFQNGSYKFPSLVELAAFYGITGQKVCDSLGTSAAFHNAAFDAETVFLAVESARNTIPELDRLLSAAEHAR